MPATNQQILDKLDELREQVVAIDQRQDRMFDYVIPALNGGERTDTVHAFVYGRRSDGQPLVWVYGHEKLEYKLATIWSERAVELPISLADVAQWPTASAPKRSEAERDGFLVTLDEPFDIVFEATGKLTDAGKPEYRFARILDASVETSASRPEPRAIAADFATLRANALGATDNDAVASILEALYPSLLKNAEWSRRFVARVRGDRAFSAAGLLAAGAAADAIFAATEDAKSAADVGVSVYGRVLIATA